jgi:hypothetical protein
VNVNVKAVVILMVIDLYSCVYLWIWWSTVLISAHLPGFSFVSSGWLILKITVVAER